jgi:hypothetical protein
MKAGRVHAGASYWRDAAIRIEDVRVNDGSRGSSPVDVV